MKSRQEIYLEILYKGLVQIRSAARAGDAAQCNVDADHLHNIPALLKNLDKEELHDYYWRAMRPSYIQMSKPEYAKTFEQLWQELEEASKREKEEAD